MSQDSSKWVMDYSNDRSTVKEGGNRIYKRDMRKKSLLSLISVILIIGLILFELLAVLFLRERMYQSWEPEKERQTLIRQLDKLRIDLRKSVDDQMAKRECSWVGNELNLLAGYYKTVQYDLPDEEVARIRFLLNKMDDLGARFWRQKQYIVRETPLFWDIGTSKIKTFIQKSHQNLLFEQ